MNVICHSLKLCQSKIIVFNFLRGIPFVLFLITGITPTFCDKIFKSSFNFFIMLYEYFECLLKSESSPKMIKKNKNFIKKYLFFIDITSTNENNNANHNFLGCASYI